MPRFIVLIFCCLFTHSAFPASSLQDLQALADQKQFAATARAGEQFLQHSPRHATALFLTAYAYQMNRQQQKAIELYQRLIRSHPQLPEPRNNLAMIYLARGDYDRASQLLVDAINTHPSYATAYENLSRIYKGIASEAYRRALSESSESASYAHKIELAAIGNLESAAPEEPVAPVRTESTVVNLANQKTQLIEKVKLWAKAWSGKDFPGYTSFYSTQHRPRFKTHRAWVEHRRKRIMRPGFIRVEVSNIQIRTMDENQAIIDFKQAFDSPNYKDRVVKRLAFSRVGSQWKIIDERVLSVL